MCGGRDEKRDEVGARAAAGLEMAAPWTPAKAPEWKKRGRCGWVRGRGWAWSRRGDFLPREGHATHKRFSSPRPRKAPGCTVLMMLFLRSLRRQAGKHRALTPLPAGAALLPSPGGVLTATAVLLLGFSGT